MLKIIAAFASALTLLLSPAVAQQPQRPSLIKILVPFAAGSTADATARAVANDLQKRVGTPVIVENMPGASTFIGAAA